MSATTTTTFDPNEKKEMEKNLPQEEEVIEDVEVEEGKEGESYEEEDVVDKLVLPVTERSSIRRKNGKTYSEVFYSLMLTLQVLAWQQCDCLDFVSALVLISYIPFKGRGKIGRLAVHFASVWSEFECCNARCKVDGVNCRHCGYFTAEEWTAAKVGANSWHDVFAILVKNRALVIYNAVARTAKANYDTQISDLQTEIDSCRDRKKRGELISRKNQLVNDMKQFVCQRPYSTFRNNDVKIFLKKDLTEPLDLFFAKWILAGAIEFQQLVHAGQFDNENVHTHKEAFIVDEIQPKLPVLVNYFSSREPFFPKDLPLFNRPSPKVKYVEDPSAFPALPPVKKSKVKSSAWGRSASVPAEPVPGAEPARFPVGGAKHPDWADWVSLQQEQENLQFQKFLLYQEFLRQQEHQQ
jgi:hypothetical protein